MVQRWWCRGLIVWRRWKGKIKMDKVGKVGYQNCQWSRQIWKIWKRMMVEWVDGYIIFFYFWRMQRGCGGKF